MSAIACLRRLGAVQDLDAFVQIGLGDAVLEQHVEDVDAVREAADILDDPLELLGGPCDRIDLVPGSTGWPSDLGELGGQVVGDEEARPFDRLLADAWSWPRPCSLPAPGSWRSGRPCRL